MRIVIEIKRDVQADVVLNQLWRHTRLQTSFPVNMLALDKGQPKQMGLIEILQAFISFRFEVVTRRTKFLLNKAIGPDLSRITLMGSFSLNGAKCLWIESQAE